MVAEGFLDGVDGLAALEALGFVFAATLQPGEIFHFCEELGKDVGGVFLGDVDAVLGTGDEGDEVFDGSARLSSEGGGEKGIAESLPDGAAFFAGVIGGEDGGGLAYASVRGV